MADKEMQILQGLGVSEGVAIGRAVCMETQAVEVYRFPLPESALEEEIQRFRQAVERARGQIRKLRTRVGSEFGEELGAIFDAHNLFLGDPAFLDRVEDRIRRERVNAEWAAHKTAEELAERFERIQNPYLRERREDLQDVSRHLLRTLQGISHHELSEIQGDVIIVADDLTPSDAVRLGRKRVRGFAVASGGRTSHTSIVARSLKVPAVVGLSEITRYVTDEDPVIVDGERGVVILHPTPEVLEEYKGVRRELRRQEEEEIRATRGLVATTRDGVEVHLMANVDLPEELEDVSRFGSAGVGLYRSEFLYIEKSPELPSEEEHLALYRRIAETAAPHPAIIRTFDLGGRKLAREVMDIQEENPVLGLRGIRLTLARPQIFRTQLRALFRAALHGEIWIMLPMVSRVEEIRLFREFAAGVMEELEREGIPFERRYKLGIMIEVPSAAIIADILAREVDFFSVGTNDLIQYSLAVDRNNDHVADLYQPLHPAILRMLRMVVEGAAGAGIDVSVCGEMAADVRYASLLVGLGLRRLSMNPRMLPAVKTQIRELSVRELEEVARRCLEFRTATEVDDFLTGSLTRVSLTKVEGRP